MMIPVILGPTASGKTSLAVKLAKAIGPKAQVVCADAFQVYRGMEIGTAQPSTREKQGVPHQLFGTVDPSEEYNVGRWLREIDPFVTSTNQSVPILCGGTFLYLKSFIQPNRVLEFPPHDPKIRKSLELKCADELYTTLLSVDPLSASKIHRNNLKRVIRALEVYYQTGKAFSSFQDTSTSPWRNNVLVISINVDDKESLVNRINRRIEDDMLRNDALEAQAYELWNSTTGGLSRNARAAIGYSHFCDVFEGKLGREEVAERIRISSRQYAMKQIRWFKSMTHGHDVINVSLDSDKSSEIIEKIQERMKII